MNKGLTWSSTKLLPATFCIPYSIYKYSKIYKYKLTVDLEFNQIQTESLPWIAPFSLTKKQCFTPFFSSYSTVNLYFLLNNCVSAFFVFTPCCFTNTKKKHIRPNAVKSTHLNSHKCKCNIKYPQFVLLTGVFSWYCWCYFWLLIKSN